MSSSSYLQSRPDDIESVEDVYDSDLNLERTIRNGVEINEFEYALKAS